MLFPLPGHKVAVFLFVWRQTAASPLTYMTSDLYFVVKLAEIETVMV